MLIDVEDVSNNEDKADNNAKDADNGNDNGEADNDARGSIPIM